MGEQVPWPNPPREPGPWGGGPPVAPPGNTALPPLPGAGGVVHSGAASINPWTAAAPTPVAATPTYAPTGAGPAPFPGLPNGPRLVDRAPGWLIAASVFIVLALVAGGAYVVLKGGRKYPSRWDARVAPIAAWVEKNRGLTYKHPVEVEFLTAAQYTAVSTGDSESPDSAGGSGSAKAPTAAEKKANDDQVAELRALGFLTGTLDLNAAGKKLQDSGSLAFYSPKTKKVYVRGTAMTPGLRVTLAHELTHVLQDQYFDLTRVESLNSDDSDTLRALAEGDATRIEDLYVTKELTAAERKAYDTQRQKESDQSQTQLKGKVPPILQTVFDSPYILGPEFISFLEQDGGAKAIDAAFRDLPSPEVLFNPQLNGEPAGKPIPVSLDPPKGEKALDSGTFGPASWYLLLATRMSASKALQAVDGYGGDHYVTVRENNQICVRADLKADTTVDLQQLGYALSIWAARSAKGSARVSTVGDVIHFRSCDPGPDAKSAGSDVSSDFLEVPVIRTDVFDASRKDGATDAQSACFGQAIVDHFTVAELTSDSYLKTAPAQQQIAALRQRCI